MFVVRNDRFGIVSMHALARDAYKAARTGHNYTVSYVPRVEPEFDLVIHLDKVRLRETRK